MPSPIRPSQFCAAVPSNSADFCAKFKAIIQVFGYLCDLFSWMFNEDGTFTSEFKSDASDLSPGDLKWSAVSVPAMGWLYCNGQAVSRTTYAALFAKIGTEHGTGDGSTTFNVPDMRDYFMVGVSDTKAIGSSGGAATVVLTQSEMPSHVHNITGRALDDEGTDNPSAEVIIDNDWQGNATTVSTSSRGSNQAHENLPPYKPFYVYIRY